jgi:hypothetical protein
MDIPISIVLSIASIIIAVVIGYFGFVKDVVHRLTRLEEGKVKVDEISAICQRITLLEANDKLYWAAISPHLGTIIHSPDHKLRDELVDKLLLNTLTTIEAKELEIMLEQNIVENHDAGKKLASALLLARTKMLINERLRDALRRT